MLMVMMMTVIVVIIMILILSIKYDHDILLSPSIVQFCLMEMTIVMLMTILIY